MKTNEFQMLEDSDFKPGTHGCHEALHMACFLAEAVHEQLEQHPAVTANQEWFQLATKARQALSDLYNQIGKEHL